MLNRICHDQPTRPRKLVAAQVLFCSDDQWEQLLVVARRGVEVEQTLSLAANAGASSEQELIFLKLQSVALEHLGNLEEAQALSQQVSQREKELGLEPVELVGAPSR